MSNIPVNECGGGCKCTEPNSCRTNPKCKCGRSGDCDRDCRGCYGEARFKVGDRVDTCARKNEFATVVAVPTNNSYDVMILVDRQLEPTKATNYGMYGGPRLIKKKKYDKEKSRRV